MILRSRLIGCGAYLPSRVVTNAEIAQRVDTTDDWIVQRSGIRQRHVAAEGELTSDLAIAAARQAIAAAGIPAGEIDMVLLATTTPDRTFPATATKVQAAVGAGGFAFDLQAVCSGFIYALATADAFLASGRARTALVIGAETFTRLLDWTDRGTCVLFGDGAGAVVLRAEAGTGAVTDRGVLATKLQSDGRLESLLYVTGGPSSTQTTGVVKMEGKEVFRHAVANLSAVTEDLLAAQKLTASDVDWLIPHQANRRIIDGLAKRFGGSADRVVVTVDRHANTSAASVPLALAEAVGDGRIKSGDLALMLGVGGGMTWGGALVRM